MKTSETIKEISIALNEFQKEVEQPSKSADNPFFKSKYVPLENVISTIKKYAIPKGLSYFQDTLTKDNGEIGVQTRIMHVSGEFIETEPLYLPNDKKNAQGAGSSITYARRYQLSAAFGIASDEDDDGNGASNTGNPVSKAKTSSYNDQKKPANDFFKTKKEVEGRIKELSAKTGKTETLLKDYIVTTTNGKSGKEYKDFNSTNIEASIVILKAMEDKANSK